MTQKEHDSQTRPESPKSVPSDASKGTTARDTAQHVQQAKDRTKERAQQEKPAPKSGA